MHCIARSHPAVDPHRERLTGAGVDSSAGGAGDSCDNAPWPRPSLACTRPRSSAVVAPGGTSMPWHTPRWNGATGSTTGGVSSRSATCHRQSFKGRIIANGKSQPWRPVSNNRVSGIPGVVHPNAGRKYRSAQIMLPIPGSAARRRGTGATAVWRWSPHRPPTRRASPNRVEHRRRRTRRACSFRGGTDCA